MQAELIAQNLPTTDQIAVAGLLLGVLNLLLLAGPVLYQWLFRKASVYLELTPDLFYRFVDDGEALFVYGSIMSEGCPITIHEVRMTLQMKDPSQDSFSMRIIQYGSKVQSLGSAPEHYFHSASPFHRVDADSVYEAVWNTRLDQRADEIAASVLAYRKDCQKLRKQSLPDEPPSQESLTIEPAAEALKNDAVAKVLKELRLVPGNYELTVLLTYKSRGGLLSSGRMRDVSDRITFTLPSDYRTRLESDIGLLMEYMAREFIYSLNAPQSYPECRRPRLQAERSANSAIRKS